MREQPHCPIGMIISTPAAYRKIPPHDMQYAVGEHAWGNWGLLDAGDQRENETALLQGGNVFSQWSVGREIFWVATLPGTIPGDTRTVTAISLFGELELTRAKEQKYPRRPCGA